MNYSYYLLSTHETPMESPWVMEKNGPFGPPPSYDDSERYFVGSNSPPPSTSPYLSSSPLPSTSPYLSGSSLPSTSPLPIPSPSLAPIDLSPSPEPRTTPLNVMKDLPPIPPPMPVPMFMSSDGYLHEEPAETPPETQFPPFEPFALYSHSNNLEEGFPLRLPIAGQRPHPFYTHGVTREDWIQFMSELKETREDSRMELINGSVVEMAEHLPLARRLIAHGIEMQMKNHRSSSIAQVINRWNTDFFHPRLMEVTLAQGRMTHTGPLDAEPADLLNHDRSRAHGEEYSHDWSVYLASDDEDDSGFVHVIPKARQPNGYGDHPSDIRHVMDKERRRSRHERRKALRKDRVDAADEKWRLVIAHKPLVLE